MTVNNELDLTFSGKVQGTPKFDSKSDLMEEMKFTTPQQQVRKAEDSVPPININFDAKLQDEE